MGRTGILMRRLGLCCLLLLALSARAPAALDSDDSPSFASLLEESGLRLDRGHDFVEVPVSASAILPYEHALRHDSDRLELRFIVRPLNRITIEYNDPHNAAPEPNHLFPLLFESMTNALAAEGADAPSTVFTEAEARRHFNADWAAVAAFDVDPDYAGGFANALLVAMHRNELADAYTLFLYDDYAAVKPLIDASLAILRFEPVEGSQP